MLISSASFHVSNVAGHPQCNVGCFALFPKLYRWDIDGMLAHLELSVRVAFQFILESFHADFSVVLGIILRSTL